jgi:hypothetical protein
MTRLAASCLLLAACAPHLPIEVYPVTPAHEGHALLAEAVKPPGEGGVTQ